MEILKNGNLETWKFGKMEIWTSKKRKLDMVFGEMDIEENGNLEELRFGKMDF